MRLLNKLKLKLKQVSEKVSTTVKAIINFGANLIGLRFIERRWDYNQLIIAGWCFLVGLPLGFIFLGPAFSFIAWASTVIIVLIMSNLDYAFNQILNINKNKMIIQEECLYTCS